LSQDDETILVLTTLKFITTQDAVQRRQSAERMRLDGAVVDQAGGLPELLSSHADAVKASVAPGERRKRLVESVFRALSDVSPSFSAIRRPRVFSDLCAIAGATPEELRPVLDSLRAPGISFLTPYAPLPIAEKTPIDISCGALIRCWHALGPGENGWLKSEFRDGQAWRTLLSQSEYFASDKESFLSEPATELRADWLKGRNEAWSQRYGGGWPQVIELIEASRAHWALQAKMQRDQRQAEIDYEPQGIEATVS